MSVVEILTQKEIKKIEARNRIAQEIIECGCNPEDVGALKDVQVGTFLEAVEMLTGEKRVKLGKEYLSFAKRFILSENNSCKREASRIVGNMAADYPEMLDDAVPALLVNARSDGTVVRWSSAYALSRIVLLDRFSCSDLVRTVKDIYETETESGVKNQYAKALKRLKII